MRYLRPLELISIVSSLSAVGSALLVIPEFAEPTIKSILRFSQSKQRYLGPDMSKQSEEGSKNPPVVQTDGPLMSDVVSIQKEISIFAELLRGQEDVAHRLEDRNENSTVLAPLNSVMNQLPRKPWEDPDDESDQSFYGQAGENRAARNLGRFVKAHIIPESPLKEEEKYKTLDGKEVWWANDEHGVMRIYPDGAEVKAIKSTVPNGQVWVIKNVINYPKS